MVSHGIVAGPGWPATDTYADLVTFNTVRTDFLYDYAIRLPAAPTGTRPRSTRRSTPSRRQGATGVVLARGDLFPDALSGVPLAGVYGGPLLLTPPTILLPSVLVEIKRVLAPGGTVILMGGTGALSSQRADRPDRRAAAGITVQAPRRHRPLRHLADGGAEVQARTRRSG